jgi:hypothetical protein
MSNLTAEATDMGRNVTISDESLRPVPAIRLGVVGHRDLGDAEPAVLRATVSSFFGALRSAVAQSLAELAKGADLSPYVSSAPRFFLVNPLAEGADQLIAEAAVQDASGYRLRCPIPFTAEQYKSFFTYDEERSISAFDRLAGDPENETILIELACPPDPDRDSAYAAAADVLLENSDLLLVFHDPSRVGHTGGTADTIAKALRSGLPVIGIDRRSPDSIQVLSAGAGGEMAAEPLTSTSLSEITCRILLPAALCVDDATSGAAEDQIARLQRFLREPLISGGTLKRSLAQVFHAVYRTFWQGVPMLGLIIARLRARHGADGRDLPTPLPPPAAADLSTIDTIQRPYLHRMALVDRLAGFYMSLYQGSFVMNFLLGAMAVVFALLAYFNLAHQGVWLWAEMIALLIILANYVASRAWAWHERALDYRFVSEYLRQTTTLAPLGRVAPLIHPSAQYRGHDPWATWMGWYVRALHREQGVVELEAESTPRVLRMDNDFLAALRFRICEEWLKGQYRYYRRVEHRFQSAAFGLRVLMGIFFAFAVAGVAAHLMGVVIDLDETAWRQGALLTMLGAAPPAFLGALHGIAVQSALDLTAGRAGDMAANIARRIQEVAQPTAEPDCAAAVSLSNHAVEAAHMMLAEVLDWRIIHQAHQVELT